MLAANSAEINPAALLRPRGAGRAQCRRIYGSNAEAVAANLAAQCRAQHLDSGLSNTTIRTLSPSTCLRIVPVSSPGDSSAGSTCSRISCPGEIGCSNCQPIPAARLPKIALVSSKVTNRLGRPSLRCTRLDAYPPSRMPSKQSTPVETAMVFELAFAVFMSSSRRRRAGKRRALLRPTLSLDW